MLVPAAACGPVSTLAIVLLLLVDFEYQPTRVLMSVLLRPAAPTRIRTSPINISRRGWHRSPGSCLCRLPEKDLFRLLADCSLGVDLLGALVSA
jgi:hypothetical protein